jgi:hypothetical protein
VRWGLTEMVLPSVVKNNGAVEIGAVNGAKSVSSYQSA